MVLSEDLRQIKPLWFIEPRGGTEQPGCREYGPDRDAGHGSAGSKSRFMKEPLG